MPTPIGELFDQVALIREAKQTQRDADVAWLRETAAKQINPTQQLLISSIATVLEGLELA